MHKFGRVVVGFILIAVASTGSTAMADDMPRTVDLIPLIDVNKDAVHGTWKLDNGALVSDDTADARLRIPYEPPEEYDFHVQFTRVSGNSYLGQIFRYSGHSCMWQMGELSNSTCGFSTVDGLTSTNKSNPSYYRGHAIIEVGKKYDSLIQVRKGSVVALIDGKVISKCSLDPSKFDIPNAWSLEGDGLGIGSYKSSTQFSLVQVVEISGAGKASPRTGSGSGKRNEKKRDQTVHIFVDLPHADDPISGPTTRVSSPVATIKSLEVQIQDSGMMLGQTSEIVLTMTRGNTSKLTNVRFAIPVGEDMGLARDDALRFIRLTYPNWYADKAELTFEDKYVGHEGGSNGTAVATLILSVIQGFQIDSSAAITGDISANGKVRAIGGISAKIRGATASNCTLVAVPMENYDQLLDTVVYSGAPTVTDIQVIGISTLDDAVAVMRKDRDPKLVKGMELFAEIQQNIKKSPAFIHGAEVQGKLNEVLKLIPQHLSAQLLLLVAQNKLPRTLSAGASLYYTFVAVRAMLPVLDERSELGNAALSSEAVQQGLTDLKNLRPMADESVRPLIDDYSRFIWGLSQFQAGRESRETLTAQAQAVDDAMAKLRADQDLMQKMLKEGI